MSEAESVILFNEYTIEQTLPNMRWLNGVLQQAVSVTFYEGPYAQKMEMAWRDVPVVAPDSEETP